jgi:phage terminase large subunit
VARLITIPYAPREAFRDYHNRAERFASIVAHRRAGKTVATINDAIKRAMRFGGKEGRFAYVAPYRQQAKDVAWAYVKHYTGPIEGIEVSESELHVTLPNGARVRLYGSDNYDAIRGIYLDGVIMDEYADHHPQAWREVIRPALADRQGWATFIGTSKGRNAFYDIHKLAESSDDWYSLTLKASETGIIEETELAAMRAQMSANEYAREMECDFDAAIEGAYYADGLAQALKDGRIGNVSADPLMAYRAYWDIGGSGAKADACAIWIVQFIGKEIRVLDYYEAQGQVLATHVDWLRSNGYGKAECILPHDGATNDKVYDVSYESALRSAGFSVTVVPNQGTGAAAKRIEAARRLFPSIWFRKDKTQAGRDALAAYHEKRDEKRGIGLGPEHDWASHGADAFGLACVAYRPPQTHAAIAYPKSGVI